ncbi:hypothetical protein ON058_00845 [Demequina sp. B12]|uniref:hypothetical protein n=1 Tax=Demequina sp. B12 TaxID=2992757 RepID=UPI00237BA55F|nr:hypothetical protein [Demequina sp. B12]MDE0571960.1 hypothetical protein [Demequina sp. B12]
MNSRAPRGSADPRLPLSLRLIGRSTLPGALFIIGVAALFVVAIPALATFVQRDEAPVGADVRLLTVGTPGSETLTITLADNWTIDEDTATPESPAVELTNAGATLGITAPRPFEVGASPASLIDGFATELLADEETGWVVSDTIEVETDAGDYALCVTGSTVNTIQAVCVLANEDVYATLTTDAAAQTWTSLQRGIEDMLRSAVFEEPQP